jgi:type II secretory pathway pseudopilin PulG
MGNEQQQQQQREQQQRQRQRQRQQNQVRRRAAADGLLNEEAITTKFPSAEKKTIFDNGDVFAGRKAASAGIVDQEDPAFLDTYPAASTDRFPEDIPGLPGRRPTYTPRYGRNILHFFC